MSTLSKLNAALEQQLNILSSASLTGEELQSEIKRNKAITDVSKQITDIHRLALDATRLDIEYGNRDLVSIDLKTITGVKDAEG